MIPRSKLPRPAEFGLLRKAWTCRTCRLTRQYGMKPIKPGPAVPPDHRKLGVQQELFMTSIYSPGSPIFLPSGTRIFNRLVEFLRKHYVRYGFEEVITPTIYKKALWAKSGHLENYAEDMYSVVSNKKSANNTHTGCCGTDSKTAEEKEGSEEDGDYGLKPMNCPGHCLIFASKKRSYRDLPIRYADFSPLHRDEISGALSGLTRVRRFHQDDGHIFCRPSQVESEILKTLQFVKEVYDVLHLQRNFRLALSTRPKEHYIGTEAEWEQAEDALKSALELSGLKWTINSGDGAFYGPKIDIVITDSDGKEHQTATIQLDFQLPKRFELEYQAPAPEYEARGETTTDPKLLESYGPVRPVMIHRAVLGSVERLMAILIEKTDGDWPFWLHPKQACIITANTSPEVVAWAEEVRDIIMGNGQEADGTWREPTGITAYVDATPRTVSAKYREARDHYHRICVIGDKEIGNKTVSCNKERLKPEVLRDRLLKWVKMYK